MRKFIILTLVWAFIFTFSGLSQAKNLYVSTTGSDSVAYSANDITHPWLTPLQAWTSAQAGDTVYFRGGTYVISSQIDTRALGSANGTAENSITFTNYPGESVTLDSSDYDITPFSLQHTYNTISGLTLKGQHTFFWLGYDSPATGFKMQNCTGYMTVGSTDNAGIVTADIGNDYVTVENNVLIGPGTTDDNVAGVWAGRVSNLLVNNNDISGFPSGIYYKHANSVQQDSIRFTNNYIHECKWGIHSVANYALIQNNLLKNTTDIYNGDDGGGTTGCNYVTISHNGLVGSWSLNLYNGNGGVGPCLYNTVTNNLFLSANGYDAGISDSIVSTMTSDYNLFKSGNAVQVYHYADKTFAEWQTLSSQDAHSLSASPTFLGGATPPTVAGYALTPLSIGYHAGSDGKDIGADITLLPGYSGGGTTAATRYRTGNSTIGNAGLLGQ